MHDTIKEFSAEDIMICDIKVIMVDGKGDDELGVDAKGIYRDAISCFWQEFYNTCTMGERERVPALRHDFQLETWTAIARVLVKGFWDLGYFPVMLSKAFLLAVLFGENGLEDDILMQSFCSYIARDEEVVQRALNEGLIDEEFIDLLERFDCRKLPTVENAKCLLLEVAHKEIVQKAQYVADCWRDVLQTGFSGNKLSSADGISALFHDIEPTNKKVLGMIRLNDADAGITSAEQATLQYLKRFVRGMELAQLKSFLIFVTGADVICVESIKISFTKLDGLARRPIAHTCGCVLELPSTYDTYADFRGEFTNILTKEKWQNDIM